MLFIYLFVVCLCPLMSNQQSKINNQRKMQQKKDIAKPTTNLLPGAATMLASEVTASPM